MPRITKRIVIGLADSKRLPGFFEQELGSSFTLHAAYDARIQSGDEYFDRVAFRNRTGTSPKSGEVGCAISHFQVLSSFAAEDGSGDDLILIAEDDARLSRHTETVLSALQRSGRVFEILLLANPFDNLHGWSPRHIGFQLVQHSFRSKRIHASAFRHFCYGRIFGVPYGTGLYLCSRRAARKYVNFVGEGLISWVADDYLYWANASRIDIQMLRPNLAGWHGESSIREKSAWQSRPTGQNSSLGQLVSVLRMFAAPRIRIKALRMRIIATLHDAKNGTSLLKEPK